MNNKIDEFIKLWLQQKTALINKIIYSLERMLSLIIIIIIIIIIIVSKEVFTKINIQNCIIKICYR